MLFRFFPFYTKSILYKDQSLEAQKIKLVALFLSPGGGEKKRHQNQTGFHQSIG